MKHLKFLLSLAVAMMIIVPVLAQEEGGEEATVEAPAAWTVSGNAEFVLKNNTVYGKGHYYDSTKSTVKLEADDSTNSTFVDDVIVTVQASAGGDISPYVKFNYEKGDENRMWIGATFKKGNFSGEANFKIADGTDTVGVDSDNDGTIQDDEKFDVGNVAAEVDAATVTYTMGQFAFTWNKGGVYGADDSFKVAFSPSDAMTVSLLIADGKIEAYDTGHDAVIKSGTVTIAQDLADYSGYLTSTPLVQLAASFNAGVAKIEFETAAAQVYVQDIAQYDEDMVSEDGSTAGTTLKGKGFYFFYVKPTVTLAPADGISVKVYYEYGLNLDTFGDDQGVNDTSKPNEYAIVAQDQKSFINTISWEVGATISAMGLTIDGYYNAIENAYERQDRVIDGSDKTASGADKTKRTGIDDKMEISVAYDIKVGEMTVTPKIGYVDGMTGYDGLDETDELGISVKTSCSF